jgi:hypothetical protein
MFISCSTLLFEWDFEREILIFVFDVKWTKEGRKILKLQLTQMSGVRAKMINSSIALSWQQMKQKLRAHDFIKETITKRCKYLFLGHIYSIHFDMFSHKTYYSTRSPCVNKQMKGARPLIRFPSRPFFVI